MTDMDSEEFAKEIEPIKDAPVNPSVGIGAIALNFALKYHNITTVQDGTLYQQYKLECKNFRELHLDMVFETAIQMERHLMQTSDRIAGIVVEALEAAVDESEGRANQDDGESQ